MRTVERALVAGWKDQANPWPWLVSNQLSALTELAGSMFAGS